MEEVAFANGEIVLHGTLSGEGRRGVVLCPPYPPGGGSRHDVRLTRIAEGLARRGIASLRFDYRQRYSGGPGEIGDARAAIRYLRERCERVGILGYSFGAVVASNLSDEVDSVALVSVLREVDDISANQFIDKPLLLVHGDHDDIAPVQFAAELSQVAGGVLLVLDTGHFFDGVMKDLVDSVAGFFDENL